MLQKDIVKGIVEIGFVIFQVVETGIFDIELPEVFKAGIFYYLFNIELNIASIRIIIILS